MKSKPAARESAAAASSHAPKPGVKTPVKPSVKPAVKSAAKPGEKTSAKPDVKPAAPKRAPGALPVRTLPAALSAVPAPPAPSESAKTLDVPGVVSIPLSEIKVAYTHSSGPGGQNVNKTSSKARIRWRLTCGRLAPEVVERFRKLYPSWVTEEDDVVIANQEFRDAPKNREACFEKLRRAILEASKTPKERIPTNRPAGRLRRRLEDKKRLSAKKKERSRRDFD